MMTALRYGALLGLLALASACTDSPASTAPTSVAPPATAEAPPVLANSVTGVVYEVTSAGRLPLADVGVDLSVEYQSWPPRVTTGPDGRYTFPNNTPTTGTKLIAVKAGYSQPCRLPVAGGDGDHDIYLVADVTLAAAGMPASFPIAAPVLDGVVFEQTPAGRHPIAGASIILDFTGGMGWAPSARTTTDPEGRYVLCKVEDSTGFGISALVAKEGYADAFVYVTVRPPGTFDIELKKLGTTVP